VQGTKSDNPNIYHDAYSNPSLPEKYILKGIKSSDEEIQYAAYSNPFMTKNGEKYQQENTIQIFKYLSVNGRIRETFRSSEGDSILKQAIEDKNLEVRKAAYDNFNISNRILLDAIRYNSDKAALDSKYLPTAYIVVATQSDDSKMRAAAYSSPRLPEEYIPEGLADVDESVRMSAKEAIEARDIKVSTHDVLRYPKVAKPKGKAVDEFYSLSWRERNQQMRDKSTSPELLAAGYFDRDPEITAAALENENMPPDYLVDAIKAYDFPGHPIDRSMQMSKMSAYSNKNMPMRYLIGGTKSNDFFLRAAAYSNPSLPEEYVSKGLLDKDEMVRDAAKEVMEKRGIERRNNASILNHVELAPPKEATQQPMTSWDYDTRFENTIISIHSDTADVSQPTIPIQNNVQKQAQFTR
jgi:hypothetical protein